MAVQAPSQESWWLATRLDAFISKKGHQRILHTSSDGPGDTRFPLSGWHTYGDRYLLDMIALTFWLLQNFIKPKQCKLSWHSVIPEYIDFIVILWQWLRYLIIAIYAAARHFYSSVTNYALPRDYAEIVFAWALRFLGISLYWGDAFQDDDYTMMITAAVRWDFDALFDFTTSGIFLWFPASSFDIAYTLTHFPSRP